MKIGNIDLWVTAKATVKRFIDSDLQGMAAEIVYHLLFSLVPLLIFLTALSGFIGRRIGIGNVVNEITTWLRTDANLPESTVDVVLTPIEQILTDQTGGLLSVGAVLALWSGKNAISALMKGLNRAYGVEETRPWWKLWAIAIGLTIALGLVAVAASVFFVMGTAAGAEVADDLNVSGAWEMVWGWLRLPLIALLLCVMISFLYWIGPDRHARYEFISIGAVFSVLLWAAATLGLGLYFQYMGGYVVAYGVLGGLLGFLFWLFLMSLILLFGGQLNAELREQRAAAGPAPIHPLAFAATTRVDGLPRGVVSPARSTIHDEIRGWQGVLPSAEEAAHRRTIAHSGLDRLDRQVKVIRLLGASAAAAVSAIVLGLLGRR